MERGPMAGEFGVRRQGPQLADDGVCWSRRARYRRARSEHAIVARDAHRRRPQPSRGLRISRGPRISYQANTRECMGM